MTPLGWLGRKTSTQTNECFVVLSEVRSMRRRIQEVNRNGILIWGLRPFQEYFSYIEPNVHQGERKPENPGKKHLTIRIAELGFPTCDPSEARTKEVRSLMD